MNRGIHSLAAILLIALPLGCKKKQLPTPPPPPITTAAVFSGNMPLYIDTFGNCSTVAAVMIVPQVTGVLIKTVFAEGDNVKLGDPLFQIDPAPYKAAQKQAQGNLETARATLVNAQEVLARKQKLYQTSVIDIQEYQDAQASVQGAQGNVLACESALDTANINLGYCSISSPIEGKTGIYLINTGNLVTANTSQMVNIRTISPIYVDYTISEQQLGQVREYLTADGLNVEITVPGEPGAVINGKLQFLDNQVANNTGTIALRATCDNAGQKLWPGLFVNVRLILKMLENVTLVPSTAVLVGQSDSFVFVLEANNTVTQRTVKTGEREGEDIIITQGLKVGEKVVTSGQIGLYSGAAVAPMSDTSPAPAASATPSPEK